MKQKYETEETDIRSAGTDGMADSVLVYRRLKSVIRKAVTKALEGREDFVILYRKWDDVIYSGPRRWHEMIRPSDTDLGRIEFRSHRFLGHPCAEYRYGMYANDEAARHALHRILEAAE